MLDSSIEISRITVLVKKTLTYETTTQKFISSKHFNKKCCYSISDLKLHSVLLFVSPLLQWCRSADNYVFYKLYSILF